MNLRQTEYLHKKLMFQVRNQTNQSVERFENTNYCCFQALLEFSEQVINSAIKAKVDYLDILSSSPTKLNLLRKNERLIKDSELCFITNHTIHPGIPARSNGSLFCIRV